MRPQVAYVTGAPGDADRAVSLAALDRAGLDARPVQWDRQEDWADADLVLVAGPHDLDTRRREFLRWARAVEDHTRLANPALTLVRSTDMTYLRDLQGRGVPVVDTLWLEPGEDAQQCAAHLERRGWTRCAVRPAAGRGADAEVVESVARAADAAGRIAATGAVAMLQPVGGEPDERIEVVVIGGRVSHAVRPGGSPEVVDLDEDLSRAALSFAHAATGEEELLQGVVVLVEQAGQWRLGSVEAACPDLHLPLVPRAADRLGHAVRRLVMPDAQAADFLVGSG